MTEAENVTFPTAAQTLSLYQQIEKTALETIQSGNAVENLLISPEHKDTRHFVSVDINLKPSPVKTFLVEAIEEIKASEIGFVANKAEHLHLTMAEVVMNPEGRKQAGLTSKGLQDIYNAIRDNYPNQDPINLRFEKIMLTPDPPADPEHPEKRSVAVVAAFTSINNETFKVRGNIVNALASRGIETSSPRHPSKVIFISLGRFMQPPTKSDDEFPIIEMIKKLNTETPTERQIAESELEIISTATKTVLSTGHVFLSPPIEFDKNKRSIENVKFLRPHSREKLQSDSSNTSS